MRKVFAGTFQSFSAIMSLKWANTKIDIKIESLEAKKLEKQYLELLTKGDVHYVHC